MTAPAPLLLPPGQFDHFYLGGARISALRGTTGGGPRRPEEWLASSTTRAGQAPAGLSQLPDGSLLRDRVQADPAAWLGPAHLERYGGEGVELLVKLLDAGQRLPVHVHPTRAFARRHLGLAHGKTEAWIVVDADPGAVVGIGLRTPLSRADLGELVGRHDSAALVEAVHTRVARPGDGILVPSGTPHFIGAGVFVVEVQEPTDLSILLEWEGLAVDGERDGHLDLGYDLALDAVDLTVLSSSDVDRLVVHAPGGHAVTAALPASAEPYFRADRVDAGAGAVAVPAGFAVLVVLAGEGRLLTEHAAEHAAGEAAGHGDALVVRRGDAVVVPWAAGAWSLGGDVAGVLCRPPAPDAPEAPR